MFPLTVHFAIRKSLCEARTTPCTNKTLKAPPKVEICFAPTKACHIQIIDPGAVGSQIASRIETTLHHNQGVSHANQKDAHFRRFVLLTGAQRPGCRNRRKRIGAQRHRPRRHRPEQEKPPARSSKRAGSHHDFVQIRCPWPHGMRSRRRG